ncbi:hypothetical protein EV182_007631, partial [Spiromyces aspiralis]
SQVQTRADESRVNGHGPNFANLWATARTGIVTAIAWLKSGFGQRWRGQESRDQCEEAEAHARFPSFPVTPRPQTPSFESIASQQGGSSSSSGGGPSNSRNYVFGRYRLTMNLTFSGFSIFSGVDSTRGLYSSTWELVKIRLLKGFIVAGDSDSMHGAQRQLKSVMHASQNSVISLNTVTTFWGAPLEVSSSVHIECLKFSADGFEPIVADCTKMLRRWRRSRHRLGAQFGDNDSGGRGNDDAAADLSPDDIQSWSARLTGSVRSGLGDLANGTSPEARLRNI